MGLFDAATVEWWLPASYLLLAGIADVAWKSREGVHEAAAKSNDDTDSTNTSLLAPLIHGGERQPQMIADLLGNEYLPAAFVHRTRCVTSRHTFSGDAVRGEKRLCNTCAIVEGVCCCSQHHNLFLAALACGVLGSPRPFGPFPPLAGAENSDRPPKYNVTATGVLWSTLSISWGLCIYQVLHRSVALSRASLGWAPFGAGTATSTAYCSANWLVHTL